MSESYLDTPYAASAIERDLTTALDERDVLIRHYQRREAERAATRSAIGPAIALLGSLA